MLHNLPIITIVTTRSSPRLQYILHHIFHQFLGIPYRLSRIQPKDDSPFILYGNKSKHPKAITIPSHELLFENGVNSHPIEVIKEEGLQKSMIVLDSEEMTFDFDLFAWLFYLLSRYEEYESKDLDDHGRYKSSNSITTKYEFLETPLVDYWIQKLSEKIESKFGINFWPQQEGKAIPSIDIDMPYAYNQKGARAYIGIFRDLLLGNIGGVQDRLKYFTTGKDPFDTYTELENLLKNESQTFVFLLQNYNLPYDLNHIVDKSEWKEIVTALSNWSSLGIHPSYESHESISKLELEKESLENQIGKVTQSRQHFLKFTLPYTYRNLITIGIKNDHSMMYPDRVGFRASTSRPFLWYDLEEEEATNLLVHPYAVMDVTLRYYMKLSPNEAILKINELQKTLENINGDLGFLWHNSSMSRAYGWKKWLPVLHHLLKGVEQSG